MSFQPGPPEMLKLLVGYHAWRSRYQLGGSGTALNGPSTELCGSGTALCGPSAELCGSGTTLSGLGTELCGLGTAWAGDGAGPRDYNSQRAPARLARAPCRRLGASLGGGGPSGSP